MGTLCGNRPSPYCKLAPTQGRVSSTCFLSQVVCIAIILRGGRYYTQAVLSMWRITVQIVYGCQYCDLRTNVHAGSIAAHPLRER